MPSGLKRVFLTPLDDVSTTDKEGVGTLRFEGNKVYKYVKVLNTTATVAIAAGDVLAYTSVTGYDNSQVCSDLTDADAKPVAAGVAQATIAGVAGTSYYAWVQVKGPATLNAAIESSNDATPVAAGDGDPLSMGDADMALRRQNTVIDANAERTRPCAVAIDASAGTISCDFLL